MRANRRLIAESQSVAGRQGVRRVRARLYASPLYADDGVKSALRYFPAYRFSPSVAKVSHLSFLIYNIGLVFSFESI